ncbi:MAG: ABC transporter permease [Clostridiales bacterium]|nr:ABC transporter permease [Clostridiales bacterium]
MIEKLRKIIPIAGLLILFIIFSATTGGLFLRWNNLQNLILQSAITMVAAVGTAFVMAHNNLDFSLGGACALSCVLSYLIVGNNLVLFFILCIVFGVICGLFSAVLHVKGEVPAFIAGMCLMFAGRGLAQSVAASNTMMLTQAAQLNNMWFFIVVLVVVVVIGYILFNYTKIGKYQKLIGTNPKAAQLSGISVGKYKTIAFIISGVTIGLASCLTVIRSPSIVGSTGTNLETNVLLALSLGGMSMTGGSASRMRSAVIGTLIFFILNNGLTLWGLDPNYVDIVKAIFFLFTVTISIDRSQYEVIT